MLWNDHCVEYTCPISIRNKSVQGGAKDLDFLEEIDGVLRLKRTHKFYTQVQGQMAANKCRHKFL